MINKIREIMQAIPKRVFVYSLSKRIFVLSLLLIFVISLLFFLYSKFITYPYLLKAEHQKIDTIAEFLRDDITVILDFEAYDNIYAIEKKALSVDGIEAIVIDTKNFYSEQKSEKSINLQNSIPLDKILLIEQDSNKFFVKRTKIDIESSSGYYDIYYSANNYYKELDNYKKFTVIIFVVMSILLLLFMIVVKITLYPLTKLSSELKNIDLSKKIELDLPTITSNDERAEIIEATKTMSTRINEYIKELNDINSSLEKRILVEVNKNREKDRVMFQQSRLASMGEMIANIAHQWRQPLAVLSGIIQNIEIRYEMGMLEEDYIQRESTRAKRIAKNMSQTIDDFRNFFEPNKKKEPFKVLDSINNALYLMEATLKNMDIEYTIFFTDKDVTSYGFASEFSQTVVNILSNAKDELKKDSINSRKINISIKQVDDTIEVTVCDNAGGIEDSIIDKIFEPYFSTKPQGEGTGLGLYMTRQIIEYNMRGKIEVYNKEIDSSRGACFKITIPSYKREE
jgi:signal transduction histidine kinase